MLIILYGNISNLDCLKELFVQKMSVNSSENEKTINEETIKLFATTWCGDCRMAKRWFDSHGIPYEYINIEEDYKAADYLLHVNLGMRSVPTIVFPSGSILI